MNNYVRRGKTQTFTAPTGGVTGDVLYLIGNVFCVASDDAVATAEFEGYVVGTFDLVKVAGTAWTEGQPLYWDLSALAVTHDPAEGLLCGFAASAAASAAVVGEVALLGTPSAGGGSAVHQIRKRFTVAEVNAGAVILPAVAGRKYRMIDAIMISVGGAAGTTTTVDIAGTYSAGAVLLVAAAQAGLTQSTVVRAGDATGAVLADGASFLAMDANTTITASVTGAAVDTATHIDYIFTYALDI